MKFFAYSRPRDYFSEDILRRFIRVANESGMDYSVNESYAEYVFGKSGIRLPAYGQLTEKDVEEGRVLISFGGDGTFLHAVGSLRGLPMPVLGVNIGRLGFLSGTSPENFAATLQKIRDRGCTIERRTMITVEGDFPTAPEFPCALNEFTLHRHTAGMVEVKAYTDDYLLAVIRGDGAIVSTPTGSTAYSLSTGGPIVAPGCGCFVLSAIAPHNFSIRPLVVPDTSTIELEVRTRGGEVMASLDNNSFIVDDGARFTVKKSEFSVFLAHPQNISFYDTLRDRIMWGLDKRDINTTFVVSKNEARL